MKDVVLVKSLYRNTSEYSDKKVVTHCDVYALGCRNCSGWK